MAQTSGGEASEGERSAVAEAVGVRKDWDGFQSGERQSGAYVEPISNPETPSPTGPLMMESVDNDVPEVDLGTPVLDVAGQNEVVESDEGSSQANLIKAKDSLEDIKALSLAEHNATQTD